MKGVREGDDPNGQNDRTDLDQENQFMTLSDKARQRDLDLIRADHYTGQRCLKGP